MSAEDDVYEDPMMKWLREHAPKAPERDLPAAVNAPQDFGDDPAMKWLIANSPASTGSTLPTGRDVGSAIRTGYMGLRDIAGGGANLLTRGINAIGHVPIVGPAVKYVAGGVENLGNAIAPYTGGLMVPTNTVTEGPNPTVQQLNDTAEKVYQNRRPYGADAGDAELGRVATNVIGTLPFMPAKALQAGSMAGRAFNAAKFGGVSGALQDVQNPQSDADYWLKKAAQVGTSALFAGGASPLLELGVGGAARLANGVANYARSLGARATELFNPGTAEASLKDFVGKQGVDWNSLSDDMRKSLLTAAQDALKESGSIDPAKMSRRVDFAALGIQPENSWITRNNIDWGRNANLRNVDAAKPVFAPIDEAANKAVLAAVPGERTATPYIQGTPPVKELTRINKTNQAAVNAEYDKFHAMLPDVEGQAANGQLFASNLSHDMDTNGWSLPQPMLNWLQKTANGDIPLTMGSLERMRKATSQLYGPDKSLNFALGKFNTAIDDAMEQIAGQTTSNLPVKYSPALAAVNSQLTPPATAAEALAQLQKARNMAKANFKLQDSVPALADLAAVNGKIDPEEFFTKYVQNASVNDVAAMWRTMKDPAARQSVRSQMFDYIKNKMVNGASDEVANASPAGLKRGIGGFEPETLRVILGQDGVDNLMRVQRVLNYMKTPPAGARFNTSGSAGEMMNLMLRAGSLPIVGKIPLVGGAINNAFTAGQAAKAAQLGSVGNPTQVLSPIQMEILKRKMLPLLSGVLGAGAPQEYNDQLPGPLNVYGRAP